MAGAGFVCCGISALVWCSGTWMKHIAVFSEEDKCKCCTCESICCVAVAARIFGIKKRNVKKELLRTPLLEITVFYFSVWITKVFFAS